VTIHVRTGLWFEELTVGDIYRHRPGRTVTEADHVLFSSLSMNRHSLHYDAVYAAGTEFGRPLVNSMYTLALVVGIGVADMTEGTSMANLGFERVTFENPVFVGDTLYAETEIAGKRPSRSRPGTGIVTFVHRGRNERDETVCAAVRAALVRCREASTRQIDEPEQPSIGRDA
jgi:acyl dehydratase